MVGSVAGVVAVAAAVVLGLVPLLAARRRTGAAAAHPGTSLAGAGAATSGARRRPAEQAGAVPRLGGGGDTLPARNPVFAGRAWALAGLADKLTAGPMAVVAVRGMGGSASHSSRWSRPTGNANPSGTGWRDGCGPTRR